MNGYVDKIKEAASRVLSEKKVDVVIGFKSGSVAMMTEPCLISDAAEVDKLVWDSNCRLNLANYAKGMKGKVAVIAKGCDSRNLVTHIIENQIRRENLYIIGVPCTGMVDRSAIKAACSGDITAMTESGDDIKIVCDGAEKSFKKADVLQSNCQTCVHRNPALFDEMIAEPVKEQEVADRFADIKKIEAMSGDDRWKFFEDMLSSCTRCYACKNACPLCYCPTCFVDESRPQWVGKGTDPVDVRTYHFLRAYHCAGRCTDCGACEAACPMDIKVRLFTKKLEKDCFENFGWEAGMSLDQRPPLDVYKVNDQENFIR